LIKISELESIKKVLLFCRNTIGVYQKLIEATDSHTIIANYEFFIEDEEIDKLSETQQLPKELFSFSTAPHEERYIIKTLNAIDHIHPPLTTTLEHGTIISYNMLSSVPISKAVISTRKTFSNTKKK